MPSSQNWVSIAWNGSVFCAVSYTGTAAATSPDGVTWTARTLPTSATWIKVHWNGTQFLAISLGGTAAATSPDGITWTARTLSASANWRDVAWNGTKYCVIGDATSTVCTSSDGITWSTQGIGLTGDWWAICVGQYGRFQVVEQLYGGSTRLRSSATGATGSWTSETLPSSSQWMDVVYTGNKVFAISQGTAGASKANDAGWVAATVPGAAWYVLGWNGTTMLAIHTSASAISNDEGATWSTALPAPTGISSAPTRLDMYDGGVSFAPTQLTLENPHGVSSAPTKLTMQATGISSASTMLALIPPGFSGNWTARVVLGGVDVSARLAGQVSVDASEGGARLASLSMQPTAGVVAPLDYVGKSIEIDYVLRVNGAEVPRRMFTGLVDSPAFDPATSLLTLDCTNDLQNRVAALDRAVVDGLIGGFYSLAVQGEIDDGWDYAQARLTTVAASLDADANNAIRLTPWHGLTAWATFGDGDIIDGSLSPELPRRALIMNTVRATFEYRYSRLRQRFAYLSWGGPVNDITPSGFQYPDQSTILSAAGGSGWTILGGVFYPAPVKIPYGAGFVYPDAGSVDLAILKLTQRHHQTVTETVTLTVTAPESVSVNGKLGYELRGALESTFSGGAWETALDMAPLLTETVTEMDYAPDALRADADYAIETLLAQAKTKILSTHRSARVRASVICQPEIDTDKAIQISTSHVNAFGKVAQVRHVLNIDAGSAITEFSLAMFGASGSGLVTPDPLVPPDPPAEATATHAWAYEVPQLTTAVSGGTPYQDSLMGWIVNPAPTITLHEVPDGSGGFKTETVPNPSYTSEIYPVSGFRASMPGVDDADRAPLEKAQASAYQIEIPLDAFSFTIT